jgi:putative aminopeptidase FrvX
MTLTPLLSELCSAPGVAGFEGPVQDLIRRRLLEMGIEPSADRLGNLVAHLPGEGPKVLLVAHSDEVGLIVRKIHPAGYLFIERIGGLSSEVLSGQRVQVWTTSGPVDGVICAFPQHLKKSRPSLELSDLFIDTGVQSRQEVLDLGIETGLPVTFQPSFHEHRGRVSGKSLDDRIGCYLLLRLAECLREAVLPCDLYLSFVVQEENLLRGAEPVAYSLQPDYVIGLDGTLAFDTPDLLDGQNEVVLGSGTVIKVMDHLRGMGIGFIPHLGLRRHLEAQAAAAGIPFQREVVTGLSTAASPLPFIRSGLPTAAVSFPLRYTHSPVEMADIQDIQHTLDLLIRLANNPWTG